VAGICSFNIYQPSGSDTFSYIVQHNLYTALSRIPSSQHQRVQSGIEINTLHSSYLYRCIQVDGAAKKKNMSTNWYFGENAVYCWRIIYPLTCSTPFVHAALLFNTTFWSHMTANCFSSNFHKATEQAKLASELLIHALYDLTPNKRL
jgi:hypothetical protein